MEWFIHILKTQFSDFNTRASRRAYWTFILITFLMRIVCVLIDIGLETLFEIPPMLLVNLQEVGINAYKKLPLELAQIRSGYLTLLYNLLLVIPLIAIMVRRLHDVGRSGWLILGCFVPYVGVFAMVYIFICLVLQGEEGENQYGEDPQKVENIQYEEL